MSKFTMAMKNNWLLKKIPRSKYWRIEEQFIWYIDYNNKDNYVVVPKWFKTDFGSIPKPLQNIYNPTKYIAYILHDYLYSPKGQYTRRQADSILRDALKVEWASFICRWTIYLALRIGGFLAFKN